ncbi:CE1 family esterase [Ketobacter sp.]|nr:MAG: hypothetical protein D6160_10125 [Ketobacter sp.]
MIKLTLPFACILFGLISSASYGINRDPTPTPPTDPVEGEACNNPDNQLRPGETTRRITIDGQTRQYILNVPNSYDGTTEVPLLLDFHPLMSSSEYQSSNSGTNALSETAGFIAAYPDGVDDSWNFGPCCTESRQVDDEKFARAIVDELKDEGCIDDKRVYAMGFSNGGGMSHYLACDAADVFAAVAPAAFDLVEERQCNPSRPISVFSTRGRFDFIVPYRGGASNPPTPYDLDTIHFLGAEGTFAEWGRINQCSGSPTNIGNGCQAFSGCAGDTEVVLCTKSSGGHSGWDANEAWNFLKNKHMP